MFLLAACNSGAKVSQSETKETVSDSKLIEDTDNKNEKSSETKALQPESSTKNNQAQNIEEAAIDLDIKYSKGNLIEEQTFKVNLNSLGEVTFASYEPDTVDNKQMMMFF